MGVDPAAIRSCVLAAPGRMELLQTLEGGMVLATHPCSGGLYLLPAGEDPGDPQAWAGAFPLHQGWSLFEWIGASWAGADAIEACGRFITGIGPSGATPFTVRILARRQAGGWRTEPPVLADEPGRRGGAGEGICAGRFQPAP